MCEEKAGAYTLAFSHYRVTPRFLRFRLRERLCRRASNSSCDMDPSPGCPSMSPKIPNRLSPTPWGAGCTGRGCGDNPRGTVWILSVCCTGVVGGVGCSAAQPDSGTGAGAGIGRGGVTFAGRSGRGCSAVC